MIIQGTSAPFGEGDRMGDEKNTYWDIKQPGISFNLGQRPDCALQSHIGNHGVSRVLPFPFQSGKETLAIQRCGIDDPGAHKLPRIIKRKLAM